jgi:hypothetical protein
MKVLSPGGTRQRRDPLVRVWNSGIGRQRGKPGTQAVELGGQVSRVRPLRQFAIGARLRDAYPVLCHADDGSDEATYWLLADDRRSWATVEYGPGREVFQVEPYGPRRLWDEVEAAYRWWDDRGRPPRDRFGLAVDSDGQGVWLDDPGTLVPVLGWASRRPAASPIGGGALRCRPGPARRAAGSEPVTHDRNPPFVIVPHG